MLVRSISSDLLANKTTSRSSGIVSTLMINSCNSPHRGGLSSLASQPTASVFRGSTEKEIFSLRWQVLHSNVRCSNPRSPGEIRTKAILCLQVGHIGRSMTELRMAPTNRDHIHP
jgi:hypothetical protein